ncbi:MAG: YncE family protein [Chloroflexota bacterium]
MTRLHPAAPVPRTLRALIGVGAALALAVAASGCTSSAPPTPTPDPFAGLADRSDQAFRQGLESYGQGQYRDALTSFEQARVLSPTIESRIEQMIQRSQTALLPQPTPVPPTPTALPVAPVATPVARSTQAPDAELGSRYFGDVSLAVVPGRDIDATAATEFFFQDQIGLHIEGLKQHLRLPFTVRVFNMETGRLVAEVQSEDSATVQPTSAAQPTSETDAGPTATPRPKDFQLVRFWDTFVWYHQGGEEPGRYVVQLFANGVLTHNLEYMVVRVPVATPTPIAEPAEPTIEALPSPATLPDLPAPASARIASQPAAPAPISPPAAAVVPTLVPTLVPEPTPTIVPTPGNAYTTIVGGVVAGLDVNSNTGRFYLADTSGVIWSSDAPDGQQRPTLNTPFNIGARSPVDLAVDQSSGYLYLSTRICAPAAPGCVVVVDGRTGRLLQSISLPGAPSDLRVDSELGLVYVGIPERQALVEIDIRSGAVIGTIVGLPQITSLALDPLRHTLYAAHLAGQVTVVDVASAQVTARISATGAGLTSIAAARGLAYAVNTATHELAVLEPGSQSVSRYPLSEEPAAVSASEDSGAVYVLSSRANAILQVDPTRGFELGRVLLASRSGHPAISANGSQTLRPRMVLDVTNQTVFASLPDTGSLAAVTTDEFPISASVIPYVELSDQTSAESIPGVLQPAADALPAQPGPYRPLQAQAPDQEATPSDSDVEGL